MFIRCGYRVDYACNVIVPRVRFDYLWREFHESLMVVPIIENTNDLVKCKQISLEFVDITYKNMI